MTTAEVLAWLEKRGTRSSREGMARGILAKLHRASLALAGRLAASAGASPRWVGKDVLRDLERPQVAARVAKKSGAEKARAAKGRSPKARPARKAAAAPM